MNQPQSTCFSYFDEIVNLTDDLARFKARSKSQHQLNASTSDSDSGEPMDLDPAMDLNNPPGPIEMDIEGTGEIFIEEYDGAAKEYGLGNSVCRFGPVQSFDP